LTATSSAFDADQVVERVSDAEPGTLSSGAHAPDLAMTVRGPPLSDIDALWADSHKRRLTTAAIELLAHTGHAHLADGNPGRALDAAERALQLDHLNEMLWRIAMRAHANLGARTAVAGAYEQIVTILDRELGISPSRETHALYRHLLAPDTR
jgi:two-component SAPR family response regulator